MKENEGTAEAVRLPVLQVIYLIHTNKKKGGDAERFKRDHDAYMASWFGEEWRTHAFAVHVRKPGPGDPTDREQAEGAVQELFKELGERAKELGPRDETGDYPILTFLYKKYVEEIGDLPERVYNIEERLITELLGKPYRW